MNSLFLNKVLISSAGFSTLALRISLGLVFIAHGGQKLFSWFGGYGLEGTGQWMASIGLEPGYAMALTAGSAEFFGGLMLVLGLLTRPAAFVLAITMLVAIVTVHLSNGFFMANNGYEFGLVLLAASVSLLMSGSGEIAVDKVLVDKFTNQGEKA